MKFLFRKLRRTILKHWTQFFSVFLMSFLSILLFAGLEGTWNGMKQSIDEYINSTNLADYQLQSTHLTQQEIDKINNLPAVKATEARTRIETEVTQNKQKKYVELSAVNKNKISQTTLLDNRKPYLNKNGVYLNKDFATANNFKIGDSIEFKINNQTVPLKVINFIQSPEKMYYTGSVDFTAPQVSDYGYGIISYKTLINQFHQPVTNNELIIKSDDDQLDKNIRRIIGSSFITMSNRRSNVGISTAVDRVTQVKNLSILFSVLFILLAILAMYTTIKRLIDSQQMDIATLRTMGFSTSKITMYYSLYGFFVGAMGVICGLLASPILSNFVLASQKQMFSFPHWRIAYTPNSAIVALLIVFFCTMASFMASRSQNKLSPAAALRGNKQSRTKKIVLEKSSGIWSKINFGNRWAIRDSLSNKIRMIMGIIGVVVGLALIMTGFGTKDSMYYQVNQMYGEEFQYSKKINLNATDTINIRQLTRDTNGQELESMYASFEPNGKFDRPLFILGSQKYTNLKTDDDRNIKNDGIYLTAGLAASTNTKKGDTINIRPSLSNKDLKLEVRGIIPTSSIQGMYLTKKTWTDNDFDFHPNSILTDNTKLSKKVKENPAVKQIISIDDQKDNANLMVDNLSSIFLLIQSFGILLTIIVLYNLGSLNFTERTRDYATLRILGFNKQALRTLTANENITITFIGLLLGIPFGYWFLGNYVTTFNTDQIVYYPVLQGINLVISIIITILFSLSTIILIGRRLKELDMIAATKGVE